MTLQKILISKIFSQISNIPNIHFFMGQPHVLRSCFNFKVYVALMHSSDHISIRRLIMPSSKFKYIPIPLMAGFLMAQTTIQILY